LDTIFKTKEYYDQDCTIISNIRAILYFLF